MEAIVLLLQGIYYSVDNSYKLYKTRIIKIAILLINENIQIHVHIVHLQVGYRAYL